ncbi:MAG: DoxX family protein [Gammaproteobacteria bacterium]|nr:DoxX family protein [Gammaproteobacteria bacterium]
MLKTIWNNINERLNSGSEFFALIPIRLILFWEFYESGMAKINGENWFNSSMFPFPFSALSSELNWTLAAYGEVLVAILILLGLFTRFAAVSLIVITAVAVAAVHWPESYNSLSELWKGYSVSNNGFGNYKLGLLFIIMAIPLVFNGAGKISLDYVLNRFIPVSTQEKLCDLGAIGLAAMLFGLVFVFLMPIFGGILILSGIALLAYQRFLKGNSTA